jgi:hypothetical protein
MQRFGESLADRVHVRDLAVDLDDLLSQLVLQRRRPDRRSARKLEDLLDLSQCEAEPLGGLDRPNQVDGLGFVHALP